MYFSLVARKALKIVQELQRDTTARDKEEEEKYDRKTALGRRNTVANLVRAQTIQKKGEHQTEDLERRFRQRFQSIRFDDMEHNDNAALRRLSTRRGTMDLLQRRRDSYYEGERRRSTVVHERRMSQVDGGGGVVRVGAQQQQN